MSTSLFGYAVIGVSFAISNGYRAFGTRRTPSCSHLTGFRSWDYSDANFCPTCGAPVKTIPSTFPQFECIDDFSEAIKEGLAAIRPGIDWTVAYTYDYETVCIGVGIGPCSEREHHSFLPMPEIPVDLKSTLRQVLEPYGVYDENTFGLHAVLYYG